MADHKPDIAVGVLRPGGSYVIGVSVMDADCRVFIGWSMGGGDSKYRTQDRDACAAEVNRLNDGAAGAVYFLMWEPEPNLVASAGAFSLSP
jgi:hypothetical protein